MRKIVLTLIKMSIKMNSIGQIVPKKPSWAKDSPKKSTNGLFFCREE